jgi:hypothetical protein
MQLEYVLTARLIDLKEELSEEDFAIVSAGVEKIKAAEERRKARELEEFDYMCRNLPYLDIETILHIAERPHMDMMNLPDGFYPDTTDG